MYTIYIRERYNICIMCTLKEVIKNFERKVYIQEGVLSLRENLTISVLVSSNSRVYPWVSRGNNFQ